MDCVTCGKAYGKKRPFKCATCARSTIYPLRVEHATVLLEKEAMSRRVEAVALGDGNNGPQESLSLSGAMVDVNNCTKAYEMDKITSDATATNEHIKSITEKSNKLRGDMEKYKKTVLAKKAELSRKRSDAESARYGLESRQTKEMEALQSSMKRINRRRELKEQDIISGRFDLCRGAAQLAGLRRERRTRADGTLKQHYSIGSHLPIYNLRLLHNAQPEALSASLTQIAYLTVRVSTYLGLRLPAEITLPHRGYPLATIFPPGSSYLSREVPFTRTNQTSNSTNSPMTSAVLDQRPLPHPRPLFIEKALSKLVKEDYGSFSLFVEGASLLAWDIAWLCKVQGISGFDTEADLCDMGRNLYNLLLLEPKTSTIRSPSESQQASANESSLPQEVTKGPVLFGQLSHGTTFTFFETAEGKSVMQGWRLQSPVKAIDKIREHLKSEMQKAEWEILEDTEWDGFRAEDEEPVVVGGQRFAKEPKPIDVPALDQIDVRTKTTCRESHGDSESVRTASSSKIQSVNGWTKVRNRNAENT